MLDTRLRTAEAFALSLDGKLTTQHQNLENNLRLAFGQIREEMTRLENKIGSVKTIDYGQDIAALRESINTIAAARGIVVETVSLRMRQRRYLTHPATLEGGYVVLRYNPRGEEPSEIHVRAGQPRLVWTGYSFDVPNGYVADVWSAGRLVASFTGHTGDSDYRIPVLGSSDAGIAVSTGREVARLSLRRIESFVLNVDRAGYEGQ